CRLVPQTVRVRVPRLVTQCVPKTLVYKTAVLSCEEIPVTVYRPVIKKVPVVVPSTQVMPTSQSAAPIASGQAEGVAPIPSPEATEKPLEREQPKRSVTPPPPPPPGPRT